jgi:hypothetical protein
MRRREFMTLLGGAARSSRSAFGLRSVGNDYCNLIRPRPRPVASS